MLQGDKFPQGRTPIRVLIAAMPEVLSQFVAQLIEQQSDMALVGQEHDRLEVLLASSEGVDVVVLGASQVQPLPGICTHLLNENPHLKIVILTENGDAAMVYWLSVRRRRLRTVSSATLISGIRFAHHSNTY